MHKEVIKFNNLADSLIKELQADPSYKTIDHAMTKMFKLKKSSFNPKRLNNKVSKAISSYIEFYGDYGIQSKSSEIQEKADSVSTDKQFRSDPTPSVRPSEQKISKDKALLKQAKQSKASWFYDSAYEVKPLSAKGAIKAIRDAEQNLPKIPDKISKSQFAKKLKDWNKKLTDHPTEQNASDALDYLEYVDANDFGINLNIEGIIYDSGIDDKDSAIGDVERLRDADEDEPSKDDAESDDIMIKHLRESSYNWYRNDDLGEPITVRDAKNVISNVLDQINDQIEASASVN